MQNFQDTFKARKRSFISAFSVCTTVPLTLCTQINRKSRKCIILITLIFYQFTPMYVPNYLSNVPAQDFSSYVRRSYKKIIRRAVFVNVEKIL